MLFPKYSSSAPRQQEFRTKNTLKSKKFNFVFIFRSIVPNEFVYGKLRFCVRGFSNGKSEVHKNATNF
ncbi:hypothetical protein CW731_05410 [Polaribacter sp. ALD11]|nr:hypothetical protein CW731_05410 [Polaribacter sp. ALD11]